MWAQAQSFGDGFKFGAAASVPTSTGGFTFGAGPIGGLKPSTSAGAESLVRPAPATVTDIRHSCIMLILFGAPFLAQAVGCRAPARVRGIVVGTDLNNGL